MEGLTPNLLLSFTSTGKGPWALLLPLLLPNPLAPPPPPPPSLDASAAAIARRWLVMLSRRDAVLAFAALPAVEEEAEEEGEVI